MNKTRIFSLLIVLVVVVGGVFYSLSRNASDTTGLSPTDLVGGTYSEHTAYYDIATNYATTTPLADAANKAAVAAMQNFVSATVTQFKKDGNFDNLTADDIAQMDGRKETLQIQYLIASSPRTISYIFTINEDTLGAHGNTTFRTFTFDTDTGAQLSLGDLFVPGASYLNTLSSTARTKLNEALKDSAMTSFINDGTTPNAQNFQNFFFDNSDFVLLFPPYQVAPYAAGPQTVRISTHELSNILKSTYQ